MKKIVLVTGTVIAIIAAISLFVFIIEPQLKFSSVVGTYTKSDNSGSMQLNNDGTVFYQARENDKIILGTWTFINNNTIQVSVTLVGTPMTLQYNLNGNQLVNTSDSNNVFVKGSTNSNPIVTQAPVQ